MTTEKLSALLSLLAALVVVVASFFQWWNITYNGQLITKRWVKVLLGLVVISLLAAIVLLFIDP